MAISSKMKIFAEKSSWIRKMFEQGGKMKAEFGAENVFDFSLGNPDAPPPAQFDQVLAKIAADNGPGTHSYMPNGGHLWVREAVAGQMAKEQGVKVVASDMLLSCGAAGGINVIMKSLLNPGDEVIFLAPYFVEYDFYVDNHGGKSRVVQTDENFNPDMAAIREAISEKTKAIIINSPNNPTGQIYSKEILAELGLLLTEMGEKFGSTIYLISDEPYRKITYDGIEVPSIFAAYSNSIIVSSYSKDLSLPGERIGYVAVHPGISEKAELVSAMTLANRILGFVNAPALMQRVIAELQGISVDNERYARRREAFCQILTEAGFDFVPPKGAFYIFPKSPIEDDVAFCAILQEEKILAVPGRGFGAPGYIRLAFCVPDETIAGSAAAFKRAYQKALKA
ncbi:pyridoxal phosphate-dependent aminotransferase [Desulfotalea psychrophila]|uniref:Aminotransferase n=1 Tax=Desulfotalea psychrophila (strain LSv54 / DSM 12343) TaxID=177439 RepID=Q6AJ13_DESPS|nr:pyridoxal phosphate-dependent aminotransferase [Desulfotalea psychrophila]CAG37667.1 probable aspartate aminotransferase [Desulfotalea psychrophila LSv54]